MTADERIEKLLNEFGQTISDLPKPKEKDNAYSASSLIDARETARDWCGNFMYITNASDDYICHLADVIDRMEWALSNAKVRFDDLKQKLQFHKTEKAEFDLLNNYMRNDIYARGYREACGDILDLMNNESPEDYKQQYQKEEEK